MQSAGSTRFSKQRKKKILSKNIAKWIKVNTLADPLGERASEGEFAVVQTL